MTITATRVIHPFPARMAPEIIRDVVATATPGHVLDPMCGSGTVLRSALEHGHDVIGIDIDPLAILMSSVWTNRDVDVSHVLAEANHLVSKAEQASGASLDDLPWMDESTRKFVNYWFAPTQQGPLARLALELFPRESSTADVLRLALSRIIITKDRGASLARDTSHSRPHKSWETNDYDVYSGFLRSVRTVVSRLTTSSNLQGSSRVMLGDSKDMRALVADSTVDLVVTSPPYLNALDYMRGHRLALVWLGTSMGETTRIRSASVGAERSATSCLDVEKYISEPIDRQLPTKERNWTTRYAGDALLVAQETARVLRANGTVTCVVGNSNLRGCLIDNASIFADAYVSAGLKVLSRQTREIPAGNRYLPTPSSGSLAQRMRTEIVLTAVKTSTQQRA